MQLAERATADEFRLIADSAPVPMWVTDLDRHRSFVNKAYVEFIGGSYADAARANWRDIIHPEDAARILAESVAGEASLDTFTLEGRFRRADGAWRWLRSVSQPRWTADGRHDGFIGVAHDITEAKTAAQAVRDREEQLRAFVNQTAAGFAQTDLQGRFTLVNDRFCALVGRPREELLTRTMQSITHPQDLARNLPLFEALVRDGTPFTIEKRYLCPDGGAVWVSNSVSVLQNGDGIAYGALAVTLDITERHEAEATLRQNAESLRLAIEGAGMATWEADLQTARGRWSPNRFDLLGYPRTADHSGSVEDWLARVHPDDHHIASGAVARAFAGGEPYTIDYRIRRADTGGERWLQSYGSRIDYADGRPSRFVGVSFDITERKTAEARQQLLIDELNHRVKNMLAIVQGIAQQTLKPDIDPGTARAAFEGRLGALAAAHNLLTAQHWSPVPMREVIAETVAPHGRPDAVTLSGPDLLVAPKTAVSIALAIHELATNAVKYGALSTPGGNVSVIWQVKDGEAPRLHMEWLERGGPAVAEPIRRGFGTRMIERGLAAELAGTVTVAFERDGVRCTVDAPLPGEGRG